MFMPWLPTVLAGYIAVLLGNGTLELAGLLAGVHQRVPRGLAISCHVLPGVSCCVFTLHFIVALAWGVVVVTAAAGTMLSVFAASLVIILLLRIRREEEALAAQQYVNAGVPSTFPSLPLPPPTSGETAGAVLAMPPAYPAEFPTAGAPQLFENPFV
eukprot:TRINITY_DN96_c0_g1_i6.p2 TRINITY_DN96_c0_g1~~TRINITY_DN96_c0_g1_i6.p2  ORF type:complete len:157 (+),score=53.42 TRINITY_DN96_c0_g1_i6:306-776(+)